MDRLLWHQYIAMKFVPSKRRFATVSLLFCGLMNALADWKPVAGGMLTRWGKELEPSKVWQEHPRPQFQREKWRNLNGTWSYAVTSADGETPEKWSGEILVPFAPEAALSGVGRLIEPDEALWYLRNFFLDAPPANRLFLHFEAVDYQTTVWINGKEVGAHKGGNTPFSFDITSSVREGDNDLLVKVLDETEAFQLHGKQALEPRGIWYSRVTGIWQTVWLEEVPPRALAGIDLLPDVSAGAIRIKPELSGEESPGERLRVTASIGDVEAGTMEGTGELLLKIEEPKLWTPEHPHLYDLKIELLDAAGEVLDSVQSYAGLREVSKVRDGSGNFRVALNGQPVFLLGTLDQGWWPDGLLTPPSDEAMLSDLIFLKAAGFNTVRKHVKVEPSRYYWHCDRLGIAVWQDQVSSGHGSATKIKGTTPSWTRMAPNPEDGQWPDEAHRQWVIEYKRMVDHLRNHPSILIWSTFNEAWGQHRSMEIGRMAMDYDPTRLLCHASGGNFWPVGHIAAAHNYPDPSFPVRDARFEDYIKAVGEMGGHGWLVAGHTKQAGNPHWGYGGLPESFDHWKARYVRSIEQLARLRGQGISASVYTQTSDVETEINGLLTYDRIPKVEAAWLKEINRKALDVREIPLRSRR